MIYSALNLTKEYSDITDVNYYLLFVDLEKKDSNEIINYIKDYYKISKKLLYLAWYQIIKKKWRKLKRILIKCLMELEQIMNKKNKYIKNERDFKYIFGNTWL